MNTSMEERRAKAAQTVPMLAEQLAKIDAMPSPMREAMAGIVTQLMIEDLGMPPEFLNLLRGYNAGQRTLDEVVEAIEGAVRARETQTN
jgi:hypothetical protein